ncbi:MAG: hypothetical protein ACXWJ6_04995 [Xanthobacteraceae bacterium]
MYYQWLAVNPFNMLQERTAVLGQLLMLRRCTVDAVAGIPNVRVHAFDNEDWITSDLRNYFDTSHIYNKGVFKYLLDEVRQRSHVLTPQNFGAYETRLRERVKNYVPEFPKP